MCVSKHDPPDTLSGMLRLPIHPMQQLQTGGFSTMGSHGCRLVCSGGNGHVIEPAGYTRCNTFILPATAILGKRIKIAFSLNHITMQKQRILDPHAIQITSKTLTT